jgi:hypothetical protein
MSLPLEIAVAVAAMLSAELWHRSYEAAVRRRTEAGNHGTAFEAVDVALRIQRLRCDYVAGLHSRPHPTPHPAGLMAAARRALGRFAYFRHAARPDPQPGEMEC